MYSRSEASPATSSLLMDSPTIDGRAPFLRPRCESLVVSAGRLDCKLGCDGCFLRTKHSIRDHEEDTVVLIPLEQARQGSSVQPTSSDIVCVAYQGREKLLTKTTDGVHFVKKLRIGQIGRFGHDCSRIISRLRLATARTSELTASFVVILEGTYKGCYLILQIRAS